MQFSDVQILDTVVFHFQKRATNLRWTINTTAPSSPGLLTPRASFHPTLRLCVLEREKSRPHQASEHRVSQAGAIQLKASSEVILKRVADPCVLEGR